MQTRIRLLRELLFDLQYEVDEALVAEAIVARATARRLVPGTVFRNDIRDLRGPRVQSFRPSRQARSFRPCSSARPVDTLASWRRGA
jgi:hypothetical protein